MLFTIQLETGQTFTESNLDQAMRKSGLLTKSGRLTFEQSIARIKKNKASLFCRKDFRDSPTKITSREDYTSLAEGNTTPQDSGSGNGMPSNTEPSQGQPSQSNETPKPNNKNQQPMTLKDKLEKLQQQLQNGSTSNGKAGKEQLEKDKAMLEDALKTWKEAYHDAKEDKEESMAKLDDLDKQVEGLKNLGVYDESTFEAGRKILEDKREAAESNREKAEAKMATCEDNFVEAQKELRKVEQQLEAADAEPEQSNDADPFEGVAADVSLEHPMQSVLIRRCKAVRVAHSMNQDALYPMLVGPAGSGKTTAARKVAIELFGEDAIMNGKFGMLSMNEETERSEGFGFISPIDKLYKSTDFRRVYEEGGVFLLDEVDASNANALTAMNAAISAPYASFPDGMVRRHKDFVLIAAANTFGNGADGLYVGRNELDAATRDRFMTMTWDYNWDSIRVARPNFTAVTDLIQSLSEACQKIQMQHVISPRSALFAPFMLLMGDSLEEVLDACVFKGLPKEDCDNLLGMVGVSRGDLANVAK